MDSFCFFRCLTEILGVIHVFSANGRNHAQDPAPQTTAGNANLSQVLRRTICQFAESRSLSSSSKDWILKLSLTAHKVFPLTDPLTQDSFFGWLLVVKRCVSLLMVCYRLCLILPIFQHHMIYYSHFLSILIFNIDLPIYIYYTSPLHFNCICQFFPHFHFFSFKS